MTACIRVYFRYQRTGSQKEGSRGGGASVSEREREAGRRAARRTAADRHAVGALVSARDLDLWATQSPGRPLAYGLEPWMGSQWRVSDVRRPCPLPQCQCPLRLAARRPRAQRASGEGGIIPIYPAARAAAPRQRQRIRLQQSRSPSDTMSWSCAGAGTTRCTLYRMHFLDTLALDTASG